MEACSLRLSFLDLSNNSLSGLPPEIGKVSILFSNNNENIFIDHIRLLPDFPKF